MAKGAVTSAWQRALIVLTSAVVAFIIIVCLYWAQSVLIPVALAIFLTLERMRHAPLPHPPGGVAAGAAAPGDTSDDQ